MLGWPPGSCPAPFIPEIRRQIENIGSTLSREYPANTARHIKHRTSQHSDCIKTYIYFFLAANGCSINFPKQCYVCMCMFVWPSSYTSRKYKIQYSVQHGLVRLCGHCVYCEAEMAAAECPPQILGIIPQTPNTQHTIFWTLPPENTLQSPTFSAAINEERTSFGASG